MKRLFREDPDALADLRGLETGNLSEDEFEHRFAERLGLGEAAGPDRRHVRGHAAARADARRGRRARAAGIRTGLVSNSWSTSHYDRDLLTDLFDAVVISAEVGLHKPAARDLPAGAERVGAEPRGVRVRRRPARELRRGGGGGHDGDPPPRRRRDDRAARGAARDRDPRARLAGVRPSPRRRSERSTPRPRSAPRRPAPRPGRRAAPGQALAEHEAGQKHGDGRVQRAGHRHQRQQPMIGGEREERVREDVEAPDRQQDRQERSPDPHRGPNGRRRDRERRDPACTRRHDRPRGLGPRGDVEGEEECAEPRARPARRGRSRRAPPRATPGRATGDEDHAHDAGRGAHAPGSGPGRSPWITPGDHRAEDAERPDRRDDRHRAEGHRAIEGGERQHHRRPRRGRDRRVARAEGIPPNASATASASTSPTGWLTRRTVSAEMRLAWRPPRKSETPQATLEASASAIPSIGGRAEEGDEAESADTSTEPGRGSSTPVHSPSRSTQASPR